MSEPFIIDPDHPPEPPDGMSKGHERRAVPYGASPFAAPWDGDVMTTAEMREAIEYQKANRTGLIELEQHHGLQVKNQNGTNYCWAFGVVRMVEVVRMVMGEPLVQLSPASVAAPIKNYRNVGGWGEQALGYIRQHGIAPESLWPEHAIDRRYDNEESRRERKKYTVTDFVDIPEDFEVVMTMLCRGFPVSVAFNWWGHLVCAVQPDIVGGKLGYWIDNSWNTNWGTNGRGFLSGSKAAPSEALSVLVATASA